MTQFSRRKFLGQSALAAAVAPLAASSLVSPFVRGARAAEPGANDKIRVGLIGSGGMGCGDLDCFFRFPEVECAVICDVDDAMLAKGLEICAKRERKQPDTVKDFRRVLDRKDVDVVVIATPDHWHALPTVLACQAGKDVYVEKPLATTIDEGRAMLTAAQKHSRVVQMGSQWKSCQHMIDAAEFVKSGKLGKVSMVRAWAWLDWQPEIGRPADGVPPAGADYDFWLGPAPKRPFNPNRFHYNFRWFWDYAGGLMTDWGVHLINMALMGMSDAPPKRVCSSGGTFVQNDMRETPDSQIALYEFPDYQLVWEHKSGVGVGLNGRSWGVSWSGTEGTILMNDAGWELVIEKRKANLDPQKSKSSGDPRPAHVRNFLDCVKSRQQPVLNLELAHHVSTVAHLGNIAFRSGRNIVWDPVKEKITNHADADKLVGVKYRKPWNLPYSKRA
ncbi:MAG: Gfo/Idh/MocA family oxidoreductase [Verrucomicrobia bacterium]|nr:Gfo/Idh/MocA family oxidoreductase [Verrucomicrobiota bacterium]